MRLKIYVPIIICSILLLFSCFASSQTVWQKYSGNPVLPNSVNNPNAPFTYPWTYSPGVMYDNNRGLYRMWFCDDYNHSYAISTAISRNGIDWFIDMNNPVLTHGQAGSFDALLTADPSVIYDGTNYKMYYTAYNGNYSIGVATSPDGIHWEKYSGNPVITAEGSGWESNTASKSAVVFSDGHYLMMYVGSGNLGYAIGLATSTDGYHWVKEPSNPVLVHGDAGTWDNVGVHIVGFAKSDSTYYLMFDGFENISYGLATSSDAVHWTKYAQNPVMVNSNPDLWVFGNMIAKDNELKLWYTCNLQICYATSSLTLSNNQQVKMLPIKKVNNNKKGGAK
ncbi:MAG: hypothetical protein ACHQQQ_11645 [Bacteroidota bacterium]